MAKGTSKRKSSQPRLDIELENLNAYKRIQAEYTGVIELAEHIEIFAENFDCRDTDHAPNFKFLDLELKEKIHATIKQLSELLETATNDLHSAAHKQIRQSRNY